MKTLTIILILALIGANAVHRNNNHVILVSNDREFKSVVFVQDGKEWGLDYLTDKQYDSIINVLAK